MLRCWINHRKRTGLHCSKAGKWDNQITVDRGQQRTTACTVHKKREGGRARADRRAPSQIIIATPETRSCALWELKPVQYIPHNLSPIVLKRAKSQFFNIEIMLFIALMHCEKSTLQFLISFNLSLC